MECLNCRTIVHADARFCNACGAALTCPSCDTLRKAGANFCAGCGAPLGKKRPDYVSVWTFLHGELETARNRWFEITKEIVIDEIGPLGGQIVNATFDESLHVNMREEDLPAAYPYNVVDGLMVESFVFALQFQDVENFCTGRQEALGKCHNYVQSDDIQEFVGAQVRAIGEHWIHALTPGITGKNIGEEDVAIVLAHYLTGDTTDSEIVQTTTRSILNPTSALRALSCASAAAAFGDTITMQAIHAALRS